jgi:hypothetical protein
LEPPDGELGSCELPVPLCDASGLLDGLPLPGEVGLPLDVPEAPEFAKLPPPEALFEFPPNALFEPPPKLDPPPNALFEPPPKLDPPPNALFEFPPKLDGCENAEADPPNAEALPA